MKRPLVVTAAGFVLGEVLALQCETAVLRRFPALALTAAVGFCLWISISRSMARRQNSQREIQSRMQGRGAKFALLLFLTLFMAGGAAGAMRGRAVKTCLDMEEERASTFEDTRVLARGIISRLNHKDGAVDITLEQSEIEAGNTKASFQRIMVYAALELEHGEERKSSKKDAEESLNEGLMQELAVGMHIQVRGKLEAVEGPRNPGEFDFKAYYRSKGTACRMFGDGIEIIKKDIVPWDMALSTLRRHCENVLDKICLPEDSAIFKAVLLGDSSSMVPKARTMYQRHGISHLLAVSGQHLSIIGGGVYLVMRRLGLGYYKAGVSSAMIVAGYGYLTGSSGSAVRAVIMIICMWLAAGEGRTYDTMSALGLASIMLLWKAPYLIFQSGFQLSFGAVLSIGGLARYMMERIGMERPLEKTLAVSLSVQIVITPVVLYHYYQHPLYGILLNLLVIPLISILMYSGLSGMLIGSFWIKGGMAAVGAGHYVLCFYEWLCCQVERLPGYCLIVGRPSWVRLGAYGFGMASLLLGLVIWLGRGGKEGRAKKIRPQKIKGSWICLAAGACAYALCFLALLPPAQRGLEIVCLDVGQGDGIVLRSGDCTVLVDGGSSSDKDIGKKTLEPYLKSRGIAEITYAIVSHGDSDHINGLKYLLEESPDIRVKTLLLPMMGQGQEVYEELETLAASRGTVVAYMRASDRIDAGEMSLTCIYAGEGGAGLGTQEVTAKSADRNSHSLVVCADYKEFHMLFTGDMGTAQEQDLLKLAQEPGSESALHLGHVQVLKTAHHGSQTSSSDEFLDWLRPKLAVISYGRENSYGHPSPEVLERMKDRHIPVMKTGDGGAVIMRTDGKSLRCWYFLAGDRKGEG